MLDHRDPGRDLRSFALPDFGQLLATGDVWEPYQLLDRHGLRVEPVAVYFRDLLAADTPTTTLRSYGNDLLRWWRFLWALGIEGRPRGRAGFHALDAAGRQAGARALATP